MKIVMERLSGKLDFYQSVKQAGFGRGLSTVDYIQAVRTLIKKCTEYNMPLHLEFVDYQKAFNSMETWALLNAMDSARIDSRYSNLIKDCYVNATLQVKITEYLITDKIPIRWGVRQGDPISPKLFTLMLEDVFKGLERRYSTSCGQKLDPDCPRQENMENTGRGLRSGVDGDRLKKMLWKNDLLIIDLVEYYLYPSVKLQKDGLKSGLKTILLKLVPQNMLVPY